MSRIFLACVVSLSMVGCHCGLIQSEGSYGFVCHQEELDNASSKPVEGVEGLVSPEVSAPCRTD